MTLRYGVKAFLSGLTLLASMLLGALPAMAATCTDRYVTEEGTLVIDQGGAFYDPVTGEAVCLPFKTGKTVQRPLQDFLSVQGTFCYPDGAGGCRIFNPGIPNFLLWTDVQWSRRTAFDYAGLVPGFGTVVTGSVTETRQKDGRALVKVGLDASNAFNWVVSGNDTATSPVIFGNRIDAVQVGAAPALGGSSFRIEFFNSAMGAPLPDLVQMLAFPNSGPTLRSLTFTSDSFGELHADFGVPEATPGEATVTMLNLQMNGPGPTVPVDNIMVEIVP
ncbi:MAG: hypothetical protein A3G24_22440 [Betaproteobacteria bacterium RIFCSPLOWO2_12_FULL_62_13]|nr:MAG: hypothetical protein A3G24_22440 [Betaproteobacteria bacterium RIFCSPLOWO2_12_FULL_62_13]